MSVCYSISILKSKQENERTFYHLIRMCIVNHTLTFYELCVNFDILDA